MSIKHRFSKIFQPIINVPKNANLTRLDATSNSQRLMLELGLINQSSPGCFNLLPTALKALNKLITIVDNEMSKINGQKVLFSTLISSKLWKNSGRLEKVGAELFQLQDRHNQPYILGPTHEEVATALISSLQMSYKDFPLRLYQIAVKYRDEMKPKFGLMRGREFLMKDMYSFDTNPEAANKTYEEVCDSYDNIFKIIGLNYIKVLGAAGNIGGQLTHEYQFKAQIGEDSLVSCNNCAFAANTEVYVATNCPNCGEASKLNKQSGIEVGHTFLLNDKYSKPLNAKFKSKNGKPELLYMGSYGLGLTRILAASVEVLSSETEIRWPDVLAPYNVVILPPKAGSKEEERAKHLSNILYKILEDRIIQLKDNVLIDDRINCTIGRRYLDSKRLGYRYIIVINEKSIDSVPLYEFTDVTNNFQSYLSESEMLQYIKQNTKF